MKNELKQIGLTDDQVGQITRAAIPPDKLKQILNINLTPEHRKMAFENIATLAERLPNQAGLLIYSQDDDIPTIAFYVKILPTDDRENVRAQFKELHGPGKDGYRFGEGNGYVELRSHDAPTLTKLDA